MGMLGLSALHTCTYSARKDYPTGYPTGQILMVANHMFRLTTVFTQS